MQKDAHIKNFSKISDNAPSHIIHIQIQTIITYHKLHYILK